MSAANQQKKTADLWRSAQHRVRLARFFNRAKGVDEPVGRLYWLTGFAGVAGAIWYAIAKGPASALAFLLGAAFSLGNLWLFDRLSTGIAPGERNRKPWQAGAFIGRYLVLIAFGYVTVNALGVNPLAVVLGLFASTAAVAISLTIELVQSILGARRAR